MGGRHPTEQKRLCAVCASFASKARLIRFFSMKMCLWMDGGLAADNHRYQELLSYHVRAVHGPLCLQRPQRSKQALLLQQRASLPPGSVHQPHRTPLHKQGAWNRVGTLMCKVKPSKQASRCYCRRGRRRTECAFWHLPTSTSISCNVVFNNGNHAPTTTLPTIATASMKTRSAPYRTTARLEYYGPLQILKRLTFWRVCALFSRTLVPIHLHLEPPFIMNSNLRDCGLHGSKNGLRTAVFEYTNK